MTTDRAAAFGEPASAVAGWPHDGVYTRTFNLDRSWADLCKLLPDGEPVQLTHDDLIKTDPTFSPDGSRIAYTVLDPQHFQWDTWVVPTLRGEPQLMMRNASGLTWTGPQHCFFQRSRWACTWGLSQPKRAGW